MSAPDGFDIDADDDAGAVEWCPGCSGCDECAPELVGADDGPELVGDDDADGFVAVEWSGHELDNDSLRGPAQRRRELERAQIATRERYVAPADLVPWRGVLGFTPEECAAYGVRELPGASPRLAAYVQRLSDGPTVSWAWWIAWCAVTGTPQRFAEPDRGNPDDWNSRKLPAQIAQRVERLRRDRRPYVGASS